MAVPEQTPYKEYTANGVTKIFPLEFDVLEQDHLIVLVNDLEPSVGSWSLDAVNDTVVFALPPADGANIKIRRDTPLERPNDYGNYNATLKPATVNTDFDNIWRKLQEMGVLNWMIDNNIKDLNEYVDSLNDETKAIFLQMIQEQGTSLEQLDAYVDQLYQNLANVAVDNGWFAEFVATKDGKNQQFVNDFSLMKSPELFDAKGGSNNDQEAFTALSDKFAYACGKNYTVPVFRSAVKKLIGNNTKIKVDSVNGDTTVCVQIPTGSNYSDIDFINNPIEKKSWTYAVIGSNSTLTNVGFYNFDDNVLPKNSWGIYFENKDNIVLNSPKFGGNGVSDIAIVDNVKNLTIFNAKNTIESEGVSLDIEPNGEGNISNINIIGGKYKVIHVLENNFTKYGIGKLNILGCDVGLLELRGGFIDCTGSTIKDVKGSWYPFKDYEGFQNEYLGSLKIDNSNLSENLVTDPYLTDISYAQDDAYWSIYTPTQNATSRKYSKDLGYYLDVNPSKLHTQQFSTQNFINIPPGTTHLCISLSQKLINGSTSNFNPLLIMIYDLNGNLIDTLSYKCSRVSTNSETDLIHEEGVFKLSQIPNAAKFKVQIRCSSGSNMLLKHVGVYAMSITRNPGNFNAVLDKRKLPLNELVTTRSTVPIDLRFGYLGQLIKLPNGKMEYFLNGSSLGVRYISKNKLYYSFNNVRLNVGANTNVIIDLSAPGVSMGQAVKVATTVRLESMVMISATVTEQDVVRILINNYSSAFDKTVNLNIIVE